MVYGVCMDIMCGGVEGGEEVEDLVAVAASMLAAETKEESSTDTLT